MRNIFLHTLAQTSDSPLSLEITRAEGCWLFGHGEKKWLDFISGIAVSSMGHSSPEIVKAVQEQAGKFMHTMVYGEHIQSPQILFAKKLIEVLGPGFEQVFFVNSGSEAVEGALKLAKKFTRRTKIFSFENSYHGATHGALTVTGTPWLKEGYGPFLPDVFHLKFNSFEDLEKIDFETACVIIEPIQAEAGVCLPADGFLAALRKKCTATGTLLIFDEIQTGLGRTGSLFAFQKYEVKPDIILLAKALGGGMPIGAFITRKDIMQVLSHDPPLGHITTFGGHPVSCAAGLAALVKLLRDDLIYRVRESEFFIRQNLKHPAIKRISGAGLLFAVQLESKEKVKKTVWRGIDLGITMDWFLNAEDCIRLAPPLIISEAELSLGIEMLKKALD